MGRNFYAYVFWLSLGLCGYFAAHTALFDEGRLQRGLGLHECFIGFRFLGGIGLVIGRATDVAMRVGLWRGVLAGGAGLVGGVAALLVGGTLIGVLADDGVLPVLSDTASFLAVNLCGALVHAAITIVSAAADRPCGVPRQRF